MSARWGALRGTPILWGLLLATTMAIAVAPDLPAGTDPAVICSPPAPPVALPSMPLVLAVRANGHELLVLDAHTLTPQVDCQLPYPLRGTPLRSPDGRSIYLPLAAGWVLRLDLQTLLTHLVRTGEERADLALSADGRWLLVGHRRPRALLLLNADLQTVRRYRTQTLAGSADAAVTGIWHAPARQSFIVTFDTLPELWELSYNPAAEPIYDGLVHDYRMGEAIATSGFLGPRRTPLAAPLHLLLTDTPRRHLLSSPAINLPPTDAPHIVDVLNLDIRRRITQQRLPGRPMPDAGTVYTAHDRTWLALPTEPEGQVALLEAGRWQVDTERLGHVRGVQSLHSHPAGSQLWLRVSDPAPADTVLLLNTDTLQARHRWHEADHHWLPVQFSAGGQQALLATQGPRSALRRIDTHTLQEQQRISLPGLEAVHLLDTATPATRP